MRLAFGAFIGLPDPLAFMGDAECVRTRWRADPTAAFAAMLDGQLAGISMAANWQRRATSAPSPSPPRSGIAASAAAS